MHYLAAATLDLALHQLVETPLDMESFEAKALAEYGLDFAPVPSRYRTSYFSHIFDGGYSAGYYGYIWSEILDADSVDWFKENGGLTRANGQRFADGILRLGGTKDAMEMYREFRGRTADIKPLMQRRGLV
jgi:peptidyl-dipeptidase Dcp